MKVDSVVIAALSFAALVWLILGALKTGRLAVLLLDVMP